MKAQAIAMLFMAYLLMLVVPGCTFSSDSPILSKGLAPISTSSASNDVLQLLPTTAPDWSSLKNATRSIEVYLAKANKFYSNHFKEGNFSTTDLTVNQTIMSEIRQIHDDIYDVIHLGINLDFANRTTPQHSVEACVKSLSSEATALGSFRAVLHAESLRAHRCIIFVDQVLGLIQALIWRSEFKDRRPTEHALGVLKPFESHQGTALPFCGKVSIVWIAWLRASAYLTPWEETNRACIRSLEARLRYDAVFLRRSWASLASAG